MSARAILRLMGLIVTGGCGAIGPVQAEAIRLTTKPIEFKQFQSADSSMGSLGYRGGFAVSSSNWNFGGFSGLAISRDGRTILAMSDKGWWFKAGLRYDKGQLAGIGDAEFASILDDTGKRPRRKDQRDAEAIATFDERGLDGPILVGFERLTRIELFPLHEQGFEAKPIEQPIPEALKAGPNNKELEAIARFRDDNGDWRMIALSEHHLDESGHIRAWTWTKTATVSFGLRPFEDYQITDMAMLPGGREFLTIERSFSATRLPGMAIRRFSVAAIGQGASLDGELVFSGRQPVFAIDNMEGLAVHRTASGETRLTTISDDNYNWPIQRTLILQFKLSDAPAPGGAPVPE